jgi:PAS domain S-box-containing protein
MPTRIPRLVDKAEQLLREQIKNLQSPSLEEVRCLVYELELQQSKLEQQNEELYNTKQQLEAYRDRYIGLYDFAPLGYATLDEDGYVQEINLAGAKMLGVDRNQITGYAFSDYVAKEDQAAFLEHIRQCTVERREVTSELRLLTKSGTSITIQLHSIPIEGLKDDILCKSALTDITQRRKMEEAIRKSQAFLQHVIDAIPDTMLVIDKNYRILLANRAARERARGIDTTVCLTCHKLSHHRDAPCEGKNEPCPLREVIATKAPMTVTHTHFDAQGKEVFVEVSAAPVFNEEGEVDLVIEACRDISDRKRWENELERQHHLLRTLIDNLPDYIYVKDDQCRFIAANLALARIMDVSAPIDLLGKTDEDFYPPELAAEYRADEEELLRSGTSIVNKDEPHLDPHGNLRTVMTTKVPLKDRQGNTFGLVGISRDITERKQAEEMLLLTQFSVDHAGDPIFWVAPNARIEYANIKACEHLGYSREEMLSLTVHDFDPNFQADVWPKHWEELKQRGSFTFESVHRTKDGRLIPVEITVNYLGFAGKEYNCAYVRDISDRKREN